MIFKKPAPPWIGWQLKWYVFALVVPSILTFIHRMVNWIETGSLDLSMTQPLYMALVGLPMYIIGGGLEEIGWRGVLLP